MSREYKSSVRHYAADCFKLHKRRQELFSQRWVGADYFHEYLATVESYPNVLAAEMDYLITIYFQKGKDEFKRCDHKATEREKLKFSEILTKYVIEEKEEKSGFEIGILELVSVHPLQIAQQLKGSRQRRYFAELKLPKCLAFDGGIQLIPDTEDWEPMAVLWKMWKSSFERMRGDSSFHFGEHVTLPYHSPSHMDRKKSMQALGVSSATRGKVMSILRNVLSEFTGNVAPLDKDVKFYLEALFPSYWESIYSFYFKNCDAQLETTNRKKPIAANFISGSVGRPLRGSLRLTKEHSAASPEYAVSSRLAADFKSPCEKPRTGDESFKNCKQHLASLTEESSFEGSEPLHGCLGDEAAAISRAHTARHSRSPVDFLLQQNFIKVNDSGTIDLISSVTSTCQSSQLGDSNFISYDSPIVSNSPRYSPSGCTSAASNYVTSSQLANEKPKTSKKLGEESASKMDEARGLQGICAVQKGIPLKKTDEPLPRSRSLRQRAHITSKILQFTHKDCFKSSTDKKEIEHPSSDVDSEAAERDTQCLFPRKHAKKPKTRDISTRR